MFTADLSATSEDGVWSSWDGPPTRYLIRLVAALSRLMYSCPSATPCMRVQSICGENKPVAALAFDLDLLQAGD